MTILLTDHPAPGGPGIEPRWSRADKDGVGTAYSALSRVWFTISRGMLNEIYFPTIDRPQVRDVQYLVTDGQTFFHDTRRHLESTQEYIAEATLGFRIVSRDPEGRYQIIKEIIGDPHQACVLLHTRLEADPAWLSRLKMYVLIAPHLEVGGRGNNGNVALTPRGKLLTANKGGTWLVAGATVPFARCSCGYVGVNDGWHDLADNYQMDWEFNSVVNGNIALTAELDLQAERQENNRPAGSPGPDASSLAPGPSPLAPSCPEFVLGLAFGESLHNALVVLEQALAQPFDKHRERFLEQWQRAAEHRQEYILKRQISRPVKLPVAELIPDGGRLLHTSHALILAHEDKHYDGAMIASMSIPWGEAKGDEDLGGYHLVWTRDMCNSAGGLLAIGDTTTPLRALIYLACAQRPDGGFHQNFWINGDAYWQGIQLDEVSFPIVLAWRLHQAKALLHFDPWPMVLRAARYLIRHGPATPQERWEENSGYSPSTLAANIAGLICAAAFARSRGLEDTARHIEDYADFLETHIERWTVTTQGSLVPGLPRHYIRLHPVDINDPAPDEDANHGRIAIRNRQPGTPFEFPAKDVVDGGFLELVRYGIRKPDDPIIVDTVKVIDAVLKVDTPLGPCWRRYNHDGYGQRPDGGPFEGWGRGRAWPLLTGERGHYELAAGRPVQPYLRAMEAFASSNLLLPEQIWDEPDRPEVFMYFGKPTGAAMPLLWAHAEYLKLVRSAADGQVFDLIPEVAARYRDGPPRRPIEVWKFNRQVRSIPAGCRLRIQAPDPFRLHWTLDDWQTRQDTPSIPTGIGNHFIDLEIAPSQRAPLRFTFFWPEADRWEGKDYLVAIDSPP
jgi:glucoamylase